MIFCVKGIDAENATLSVVRSLLWKRLLPFNVLKLSEWVLGKSVSLIFLNRLVLAAEDF